MAKHLWTKETAADAGAKSSNKGKPHANSFLGKLKNAASDEDFKRIYYEIAALEGTEYIYAMFKLMEYLIPKPKQREGDNEKPIIVMDMSKLSVDDLAKITGRDK